ncbi:hypothetical protein DLAC_11628 [Tieghemostelium lacteum]|uniref:AAA+ ATPase domain-containing protein n=1 Tax=Tieghemostelium lacteum TaxID=361077 RepID=A0A151ZG27_TIELA|nr:hypothetical protein DLAC_11628 [Tieghemostelium lacteum]|eukprot:KYQ92869.1 hypothetical protein DLAC_11628 [Tieghemostelium lacteum]
MIKNISKLFYHKRPYSTKPTKYESYTKSWYEFEGLEKLSVTTTGIDSLDYQLKIKGLPENHIIEIHGDSSSGKSTLSLYLLSQLQKQSHYTSVTKTKSLYIDTENSFNTEWAKLNGVDVSNCLVNQPNSFQEAIRLIQSYLQNNRNIKTEKKYIILDSLCALPLSLSPKDQMAEISDALKMFSEMIRDSGSTLILTNQLRFSIHDEEIMPFAKNLINNYIDISLQLQRDRYLVDKNNKIIGTRNQISIQKNHLAHHSPDDYKTFKSLNLYKPTFDIYFKDGISMNNDIITLSKMLNLTPLHSDQDLVDIQQIRNQNKKLLKLL